jgi:hypothetical protein
LRTVRVVVVRRTLGPFGCCMACNLAPSFLGRVSRRVRVLLGGLRLLLRVDRTNGIVDYLLVVVCGWLSRLGCRCVLPRYDLNELARAVALAHGLRCCSSMSG